MSGTIPIPIFISPSTINQLNINNCGSPIDYKSDDKITNSSLSSIHNYIRMLSDQNINSPPYNTIATNDNKYDYDHGKKSTKRLGTIELSLSKKKLCIPPNTKDLYKPNELINNPYISRTLLKKMNDIIIENSHSIKQFKKKIVEKNNVYKQEETRAQTENKKNQILTLLDKGNELNMNKSSQKMSTIVIQNAPNMKNPSLIKKVKRMKKLLDRPFDSNININSNGNLNTIGNTNINTHMNIKKQKTFERTIEPLVQNQNMIINSNLNLNSNVNNNGISCNNNHNIAILPNGIQSRLMTMNSSKDLQRKKREAEKNDFDLFKSQLSQPRDNSASIKNFNPKINMRDRNRKRPDSYSKSKLNTIQIIL